MSSVFLCFNLIFLLYISEQNAHYLPPYFPTCCLKDSDFNDCFLEAANSLRPYIRKGIPDIDLPSFAKYTVPIFSAVYNSEVSNFTTTMQNWTLEGLDNYEIKSARFNPDSLKLTIGIEFPPTLLNCQYEFSGTLLNISFDGDGEINGAFGAIKATIEITGKTVTRKSEEDYTPIGIKVKLSFVDGFVAYVKGIFDGNRQLEYSINQRLNEYSKAVMEAGAAQVYEELAQGLIHRYLSSVTRKIPFSKIFPCS